MWCYAKVLLWIEKSETFYQNVFSVRFEADETNFMRVCDPKKIEKVKHEKFPNSFAVTFFSLSLHRNTTKLLL